jgi:hypothetical protein
MLSSIMAERLDEDAIHETLKGIALSLKQLATEQYCSISSFQELQLVYFLVA